MNDTTRRHLLTASPAPKAVLIDPRVLAPFVDHSVDEYKKSLETSRSGSQAQHLPRSWGVLIGCCENDALRVKQFVFARNVRETDSEAISEFNDVIAPCFGKVYANTGRGFWCDPAELLKITREADAEGLEVLGSAHMHPDWHQIGPERERRQQLSERPTFMDEYLFRNTGWPLNIIHYLESRGDEIVHTSKAWTVGPMYGQEVPVNEIPIRFTLLSLAQRRHALAINTRGGEYESEG